MSGHEEETTTVRLSGRNTIRFAPFAQAPRAAEGRLFEISGEYDPDALASAVAFLVNDASYVYARIEHSGGNLRIVLQRSFGWLIALPFHGNTPPAIAIIHQKVGEIGETTVLGYTLYALCSFLGWNPEEVDMGEMSPRP